MVVMVVVWWISLVWAVGDVFEDEGVAHGCGCGVGGCWDCLCGVFFGCQTDGGMCVVFDRLFGYCCCMDVCENVDVDVDVDVLQKLS